MTFRVCTNQPCWRNFLSKGIRAQISRTPQCSILLLLLFLIYTSQPSHTSSMKSNKNQMDNFTLAIGNPQINSFGWVYKLLVQLVGRTFQHLAGLIPSRQKSGKQDRTRCFSAHTHTHISAAECQHRTLVPLHVLLNCPD